MDIAICHVTLAPVMSEASHKSEQETQVLFGESVTILEQHHNWSCIQTHWDGYKGWVLSAQFTKVALAPDVVYMQNFQVGLLRESNHEINLPAGASLPLLQNNYLTVGNKPFQLISKSWDFHTKIFNAETIIPIVFSYLYTPYLWGGRTHFGIDCSGFSAMLFKYFGYPLKHDASWQALQGTVLDFLQNAKIGDLAFFDDENGDITHVGILLNDAEIIHATETAGCVTIDDIDNEGIISRISNKRTHKLRVVKRIL